jgi:hypothetical protein
MSRAEARAALAIVAITFVVYVATLYPDVPGGDSGEIIGALATGGVIHPPGIRSMRSSAASFYTCRTDPSRGG